MESSALSPDEYADLYDEVFFFRAWTKRSRKLFSRGGIREGGGKVRIAGAERTELNENEKSLKRLIPSREKTGGGLWKIYALL